MRVEDLEQGSIYEGKTGGRRELMAVDSNLVSYRVIWPDANYRNRSLYAGEIGTCAPWNFAAWAQKDVTAEYERGAA